MRLLYDKYFYFCIQFFEKFFEPIPQCSIWELQNSSGKFEYIDGYISVQYFDYELMGEQYHDDIIFLWESIIIGLQIYFEKNYTTISFPDTALELILKQLPKNQLLFSIDHRKEVLPATEFLNSLLSAADIFFNWTGEISQLDIISKMRKNLMKF